MLRVDLHRSVQYRFVRGRSAASCERAAHGQARLLEAGEGGAWRVRARRGARRARRGARRRARCAGARRAHLAHRLAGAALEQRLEGRVPVERGVGLVKMQRLDE